MIVSSDFCVFRMHDHVAGRTDTQFGLGGSTVDSWCTLTRGVSHGDGNRITREVQEGILIVVEDGSSGYVRFGIMRVARSNKSGERDNTLTH